MAEDAVSNIPSFEDFGRDENGCMYWRASVFMQMLGYNEMKSFQNAINRAIRACMSLGIEFNDHFIHVQELEKEYKLTRFACYLIAMNGDPKKEPVAKAQIYFAQQTRKIEVMIEQAVENLERIIIRDELKEGTKELQKAAAKAGVTKFDNFNNQGYLGLYNMNLYQLRKRRGLNVKDNISDFMGRTELAANLFRVTQTEEKLKNSPHIKTQNAAENAHLEIAKRVRQMVIANTGTSPENLPIAKKIDEAKKDFKKLKKTFDKLDKPKK